MQTRAFSYISTLYYLWYPLFIKIQSIIKGAIMELKTLIFLTLAVNIQVIGYFLKSQKKLKTSSNKINLTYLNINVFIAWIAAFLNILFFIYFATKQ